MAVKKIKVVEDSEEAVDEQYQTSDSKKADELVSKGFKVIGHLVKDDTFFYAFNATKKEIEGAAE
jgi:hypothetical protein